MTKYLNSATCTVYKKVYQSIPDSPYAHDIADSMCRQAQRMKINPDLSAEEIVTAIRMKNGDLKSYPPSTVEGNPAVPDKKYPVSQYSSKQEMVKALVVAGLSLAAALAEANKVFGPGEGTASGKMKAKKSLGSRTVQVHNASLSTNEVSSYLVVHGYQNVSCDPSETTATSNLKSGSDEQGAKNWLTIQMHQDGKKFEDQTSSKIKSASVNDNAWLFTDRKLVNRNAFEYQRQEAEKKSNIRNASTTTDNRPAWLQIMDYYAKGSPN